MKIETRKVEKTEVVKYICEFCGKESRSQMEINQCETKHRQDACSHSGEMFYLLDDDDRVDVVKKCKDCGITIGRLELQRLDVILEQVYELLEKK